MSLLQKKLEEVLPAQIEEIKALVKANGSKVVSEVTLAQAYGGMRGVKGLVCDTSVVPPEKGLIIRGNELNDVINNIPEDIFFLLLTGKLPNAEEKADLHNEFKSREEVPEYVWATLNALPTDSHPMTMFNTAILAMQGESKFSKQYAIGMQKSDYWKYMLEDSLDIIAKLPAIAAFVYRKRFGKGDRIESNKDFDWSKNYVHMMGFDDPEDKFAGLMRVYLTAHTDHEGGNASAFTASTINSTLADMYYTISGGLNALAGPLHGLANQECLKWILETMEKFGGVPTEEQVEKYAWDTLNSGKVIPGYGHAVLRVVDPRFTAFHNYGKEHCMHDDVFQTVDRVFTVVPKVLGQIEKISNPWPNVDAGSGSLLYHYGLKEFSYYTVLFSVSRAMGIAAQNIISRAYGLPLTRPKSIPTFRFKEMVGA